MTLLTGPLVALLMMSPPSITPKSAAVVQSAWEYVKEIKDLDGQLERIADRRLDSVYCDDTVSAHQLLDSTALPYELRDVIRARHEARPEMAALLVRAGDLLGQREPNATITIGDIAQVGCGQIRYGTIVTLESEADATALLGSPSIEFGQLTSVIPAETADFLDEFPRFEESLGPVWVERVANGKTPDGRIRMEMRRFDAGSAVGPESMDRLLARTAKRFKGKDVVWDTVEHTVDGAVKKLRRGRWFSDAEGRWAELVLRPVKSVWPLRAEKVVRVREALIDAGKPTSLKFEERYVFDFDGDAGVRATRLIVEYEAHHASHLGGLDADLSYVTHGNVAHFMPSLMLLDRRASWRWMKAIHRAADDLGIPLKALFVDKSIIRAFRTVDEAKKGDPTWRKIHAAPGHDSHVHVRIGAAPRFAGKNLAQILALARP